MVSNISAAIFNLYFCSYFTSSFFFKCDSEPQEIEADTRKVHLGDERVLEQQRELLNLDQQVARLHFGVVTQVVQGNLAHQPQQFVLAERVRLLLGRRLLIRTLAPLVDHAFAQVAEQNKQKKLFFGHIDFYGKISVKVKNKTSSLFGLISYKLKLLNRQMGLSILNFEQPIRYRFIDRYIGKISTKYRSGKSDIYNSAIGANAL